MDPGPRAPGGEHLPRNGTHRWMWRVLVHKIPHNIPPGSPWVGRTIGCGFGQQTPDLLNADKKYKDIVLCIRFH